MPQINTPEDPNRAAKLQAFDRLLTIMDQLRENCPLGPQANAGKPSPPHH